MKGSFYVQRCPKLWVSCGCFPEKTTWKNKKAPLTTQLNTAHRTSRELTINSQGSQKAKCLLHTAVSLTGGVLVLGEDRDSGGPGRSRGEPLLVLVQSMVIGP